MDSQLKKGSLVLCILLLLKQRDCYGYEVLKEIGEELNVKEGTLYLILQRLEKNGEVDTYTKMSDSGRKRKYYSINSIGLNVVDDLMNDFEQINTIVKGFIVNKEGKDE